MIVDFLQADDVGAGGGDGQRRQLPRVVGMGDGARLLQLPVLGLVLDLEQRQRAVLVQLVAETGKVEPVHQVLDVEGGKAQRHGSTIAACRRQRQGRRAVSMPRRRYCRSSWVHAPPPIAGPSPPDSVAWGLAFHGESYEPADLFALARRTGGAGPAGRHVAAGGRSTCRRADWHRPAVAPARCKCSREIGRLSQAPHTAVATAIAAAGEAITAAHHMASPLRPRDTTAATTAASIRGSILDRLYPHLPVCAAAPLLQAAAARPMSHGAMTATARTGPGTTPSSLIMAHAGSAGLPIAKARIGRGAGRRHYGAALFAIWGNRNAANLLITRGVPDSLDLCVGVIPGRAMQ